MFPQKKSPSCIFRILLFLPLLFGCSQDAAPPGGVVGAELLQRLGGLWSGSATQTPLGTFPYMNMDLRAADPHTLFSRADLDNQNSLRFAFFIETHDGKDVVVFRNGGYFQGILRDTRTELLDVSADRYHFCSVDRGCDYLDATWTLQSAKDLVLDVKVRGEPHTLWSAQQLETRSLPQPFPVDQTSAGAGDAPFPAMPLLSIDVDLGAALAADADVWVLLSRDGCPLTGDSCAASRTLRATATAGSTHVTLLFEQIHAGDYQAMALLDRGRTFGTTLHPNHGDGVTWPLNQPVTVPSQGTGQAALSIGFSIP